jgi:hypothetical protein
VAAIPHKSRAYRSILDLSSALWLTDGGVVKSFNNTTTKLAPQGTINQLGHLLKRIIHAFSKVEDDVVVLMAKWDIHDGYGVSIAAKGRSGISAMYGRRHQGSPCS